MKWDDWVADYSTIRRSMEETWPVMFKDYNERLFQPGGFIRPLAARNRVWETKTGKANFLIPDDLVADTMTKHAQEGADVMKLITTRSNDQFNTTVYGYNDRFRGVSGTRQVLFMNEADIARFGCRRTFIALCVPHLPLSLPQCARCRHTSRLTITRRPCTRRRSGIQARA